MKIGVIGAKNIHIPKIGRYLVEADEIITGGRRGVGGCASEFARRSGIPLTEIPPKIRSYGRAAHTARNRQIIDRADLTLIFWDLRDKETKTAIRYAEKSGKTYEIIYHLT